MVAPPLEVEEKGSKKWELCLVGRFLDMKLPPGVVSAIIRKLWLKAGIQDIIPLGKGVFIFYFFYFFIFGYHGVSQTTSPDYSPRGPATDGPG